MEAEEKRRSLIAADQIEAAWIAVLALLSSTLYIFGSGPGPEDALVRDERERFVEGHDDATHVIDILPFAPV